MKEPQFSIIIPVYNRGKMISDTLESISKQTFTDFEVVVVNDGSTDDTLPVLHELKKQYPWLVIVTQENHERAYSRNRGIEATSGKYITFCDSDDGFFPNHLSTAAKYLEKNPRVLFFHQGTVIKNEKGKTLWKVSHNTEDLNYEILKGNLMSCIGMFCNKAVFQQCKFNEERDLTAVEDWDLWLRLAARYTLHALPEITSYMIIHGGRSMERKGTEWMMKTTISLEKSLRSDKFFMDKYGHYLPKLIARRHTYLALHLALRKERKKAWEQLKKGLSCNWKEIFYKRTLVVFRALATGK